MELVCWVSVLRWCWVTWWWIVVMFQSSNDEPGTPEPQPSPHSMPFILNHHQMQMLHYLQQNQVGTLPTLVHIGMRNHVLPVLFLAFCPGFETDSCVLVSCCHSPLSLSPFPFLWHWCGFNDFVICRVTFLSNSSSCFTSFSSSFTNISSTWLSYSIPNNSSNNNNNNNSSSILRYCTGYKCITDRTMWAY